VTSSDTSNITWGNEQSEAFGSEFNFSQGMDNDGFWEGIKAADLVTGLNYRAISIPAHVHNISDEQVMDIINNEILPFFSGSQFVFDRPVEMWDDINIDFVGSVDGIPFSGGNTDGMGTDVTVGVTNYIDDFLLQLIGHVPGTTVNVEVTFPSDYHEPSLAGKDALFVTTINYIIGSADAVLTDEFVLNELYIYFNTSTVSELNYFIANDIRQWDVNTFIMDYLASNVTVTDMPDVIVQYQINALKERYRGEAAQFGMGMEDFLEMFMGITDTNEFFSIRNDEIREQVTLALVIQAIAESENITVSNEDIMDYVMYVDFYGVPFLKNYVMQQKVIEYVTALAVFE
jgi:trigger factor